MNGYQLVRKQAEQDTEINNRLRLTGGTLTNAKPTSPNKILIGQNTLFGYIN